MTPSSAHTRLGGRDERNDAIGAIGRYGKGLGKAYKA